MLLIKYFYTTHLNLYKRLKSVVQVRIELTTPAFPYAISIHECISTMSYQLRDWTVEEPSYALCSSRNQSFNPNTKKS